MKLRCKETALGFTKGNVYQFAKNDDPPGWFTLDDMGKSHVFFELRVLFEPLEKDHLTELINDYIVSLIKIEKAANKIPEYNQEKAYKLGAAAVTKNVIAKLRKLKRDIHSSKN